MAVGFSSPLLAQSTIGFGGLFPRDDVENAFGLYLAGKPKDNSSVSWYFDGYFSGPSDDSEGHYGDDLSESTFGDPIVDRKDYYTGLHIGPSFGLSSFAQFYAGLGVMWKEEVIYLHDPYFILDSDGEYSVDGKSETQFSVSVGLLFYVSKVSVRAGYVSAADAVSVGVGWNF